MAERYDIKQDENGSIIVQNNDFVYDLSDQQHIQDTINGAPGWWKENHPDGVNVRLYIRSSGKAQELSRKIKLQLESDLYNVGTPIVKFETNGQLNIDPNVNL